MWLEDEDAKEVEVTEAAGGGDDASERFTFFCGGGC